MSSTCAGMNSMIRYDRTV